MTAQTIPAATSPYRFHGVTFSVAALAIVAASIEERLSYNREVEAFCKDRWLALHPATPLCVTGTDAEPWEQAAAPHWAQEKQLKQTLAALPRGTYGRIRADWKDDDGPRLNRCGVRAGRLRQGCLVSLRRCECARGLIASHCRRECVCVREGK